MTDAAATPAATPPADLTAGLVELIGIIARTGTGPAQREHLATTVLQAMAWWIIRGREASHDPDLVDQIALQSAQRAVAVIALNMKARQGEAFSPARVAMVAYAAARAVAESGAVADLDGLAGAIDDMESDASTERDRLRELIEDIADMDVGDIEMEHREIIARCRAARHEWAEGE